MKPDYSKSDEFADFFAGAPGDRTAAVNDFVRGNPRLFLNLPRIGVARRVSGRLKEGPFSDYYEFEKSLARRLHPLLAGMNLNILSDLRVNALFAEKYQRYVRDINYIRAGNRNPGMDDFKKVILSMTAEDGHYMVVKFYDLELRRINRDLFMALKPAEMSIIRMKKSLEDDEEKNASMVRGAFKSFMKRNGESVAAMLLKRMEWDDDLRKYIPRLGEEIDLPPGALGSRNGVMEEAAVPGEEHGRQESARETGEETGEGSTASRDSETAPRAKIINYADMIRRNYLDAVADDDGKGIGNIVSAMIMKNEKALGGQDGRDAVREVLALWLDDQSIADGKRRIIKRIVEEQDEQAVESGPVNGGVIQEEKPRHEEEYVNEETSENEAESENSIEARDLNRDGESAHPIDETPDDILIDDDILDTIPDGAHSGTDSTSEIEDYTGDVSDGITDRAEVSDGDGTTDDISDFNKENASGRDQTRTLNIMEEPADREMPEEDDKQVETAAEAPATHDDDSAADATHDEALAALIADGGDANRDEFLIDDADRGVAADRERSRQPERGEDPGFLIADKRDDKLGKYDIKEKVENQEKHFKIKDIRPVEAEEGTSRTVRVDEDEEGPGVFDIADEAADTPGSYDIKEKIGKPDKHFAIKDIEPDGEIEASGTRSNEEGKPDGPGGAEKPAGVAEPAGTDDQPVRTGEEEFQVRDEILFEDPALTRKYKLEERARKRKEKSAAADTDAGGGMERFIEAIGSSESVQDINEEIRRSGLPPEVGEGLHRIIESDGFDEAFEYITQSGEFDYRVKILLLEKWLKAAGERRGWFETECDARMAKIDRMIKFYMNILTGSKKPETAVDKERTAVTAAPAEKKTAPRKSVNIDEEPDEEDESAPVEKRVHGKILAIIRSYADSIDEMEPFYRKVLPRMPGEFRKEIEDQISAVMQMKHSLVKRTVAMLKSKKPDPTVLDDLNASTLMQQYVWSETIAGKGKGAALEDLFGVFEHEKDFHKEIDRILKIIRINNKNDLLKNMRKAESKLISEFTASLDRERLKSLWIKTQHRQNKDKLKLVRDLVELIGDLDPAGPVAAAPEGSGPPAAAASAAQAPAGPQLMRVLDEFQKLYRSERHRRLAEKRVAPIREYFTRLARGEETAVQFVVEQKPLFVEFLRFVSGFPELKENLDILPAVRFCKRNNIL